ncbi:MAG: metal-dependent hydrolase [Halieaceae bacterium]|jgi:inner membrane protein|nr:metal-dependent hydrolase [Halieaceae bacterium]
MDPLTQGALGASLAQGAARREAMGLATLAGVLGGMAPDLDVLIRDGEDPLLFLEYHRQFSHSLIFIPIGAALVAVALHAVLGRRRGWSLKRVYCFCLLGYATHALLDACTSYGTQLLWPFSDARFAWNNVSIIDPLVTLPLLLLITASLRTGRALFARLALLWTLTYLGLGGVTARNAAEAEGYRLAASRGHDAVRVEAKPSFGNILLWKTVYRAGDHYYVDAVRLGFPVRIYEGDSIAALDLARDFPWLDAGSLQARDVERFRWFSMGYLARDPERRDRIIDLRYSLLPNEIRPLWGIVLDETAQYTEHVAYETRRDADPATWRRFWSMLRGLPPERS